MANRTSTSHWSWLPILQWGPHYHRDTFVSDALGASNLSAAFTGGFPVTGGFARSVVNFDAGAQTPAAGIFTAIGITQASLLLTPALYFLPQATLAASIIVAVLSLVDFSICR